ncbi:IS630 family transposase [Nitrosococcus wardiae]|uniref:IS630 family transposase n=1 Tax=Nitrosococcus wardiae TaxID=1814290 RepID=UPI00141BF154|nr:IS630 family transposase [Nitrosococcus wardiae]
MWTLSDGWGKKTRLRWKRIRRSLKDKRDPHAFEQGKQVIEVLRTQCAQGDIDLYFFDASGFSLTPCVPYAWQPLGEWIEVPMAKSRRVNVLGFLHPQGLLHPFVFEGSVDTEVVIAAFDALCQTLTRPTWVVLDNAPQHTSQAFKARLPEWEKAGLFLYYLPPYCPELNLIEILWRFIKYRWLPFSVYQSYATLKEALENRLANFGKEYHITFA